jgi:ligand-binding sensor domain-containing protein
VKRILAYLLLLQLACLSVSAQYREYFFTHYGKREGLASNEASSIVQDEKGFLWIGTLNGLQRFDGTRFLTFRKSGGSNMPSSYIVDLHFDKQKRLWVVFGGGKLGIFDRQKFRFAEVHVDTSDPNVLRRRKQVIEDASGNIYLVVPRFIFFYNETAGKFVSAKDRIKIPPGWKLSGMMPDSTSKKFWIIADSGLAVFNSVTGKLSYPGNNEENEPAIRLTQHIRYLNRILVEPNGRIWLKSNPPPYRDFTIHTVNVNQGSVVNHQLKDQISGFNDCWGFFLSKSGTIWLRGYRVLAEYIERDGKFKAINNNIVNDWGIQFDVTNNLFEDREQNIWIATYSSGIYRYNPTTEFFKAVKYAEGTDKAISSFAFLQDGNLLVGVADDKLYRYDAQLNNVPVNIPGLSKGLSVYSMHHSKDKRHVLIAGNDGLYIYDQIENKTTKPDHPGFNNLAVNSVFEDAHGNFWANVPGKGLYKLILDNNSRTAWTVVKIPDFPADDITGNFTDHDRNLWVSTMGNGLFKIDPLNNKILKRVKQDIIRCITALNDSSLLISATGLLIYDVVRDTMQPLGFGGELLANVISMQQDRSGRIWAGLSDGLCRLDLQKKSILYFDRNDGMVNDGFSIGVSSALPNGRMAFATPYSFVVFDPQQIEKRKEVTVPLYTGFSVANRPLSVDSLLHEKVISLDRENNSIVIQYSGMSFRKDYKLSYMMEGIDKEWRDANNLNEAVYNYLPAGSYTFRLKTEDDKGVVAEAIPLKIKVHPAFWLTWWFYGIVALVVAFIFYWLDRTKQEKRRALQHMRSQIAGDLHHEINVTLNNIYMLSEMARIKADNNAPLSKEYIGQIHDKSRTMITAMDDILWSINPENDNMEKFFQRIRELTGALSSGFDADISVSIPAKVRSLNLDVKHRLLFFLLFKDALQVVVALGQGRKTDIDIDMMKGDLLFRLQDGTAQIDQEDEKITAIIKTMQERVDQLEGELNIQQLDKGVTVVFRSPVKL